MFASPMWMLKELQKGEDWGLQLIKSVSRKRKTFLSCGIQFGVSVKKQKVAGDDDEMFLRFYGYANAI